MPKNVSHAALLLLAASACSQELLLNNNVADLTVQESNALDNSEQADLYLHMQRASDPADQRQIQSTANLRLRMARPLGVYSLAKSMSPSPLSAR
jgi:hypothetical protein